MSSDYLPTICWWRHRGATYRHLQDIGL